MAISDLIGTYGYLAVAVGAILEGETVLILAGAAASRGHLWLPAVILIGLLASFAGDQFCFFIGRRYGSKLFERFPSLSVRTAHARDLLERHHTPMILAIRFLYGLRIAGPITIGMSGVSWLRFLLLNLIGAIIWASIIAGIGYGFGQAIAHLLGKIDADELWSFAVLMVCVLLWFLLVRSKRLAGTRLNGPPPP